MYYTFLPHPLVKTHEISGFQALCVQKMKQSFWLTSVAMWNSTHITGLQYILHRPPFGIWCVPNMKTLFCTHKFLLQCSLIRGIQFCSDSLGRVNLRFLLLTTSLSQIYHICSEPQFWNTFRSHGCSLTRFCGGSKPCSGLDPVINRIDTLWMFRWKLKAGGCKINFYVPSIRSLSLERWFILHFCTKEVVPFDSCDEYQRKVLRW